MHNGIDREDLLLRLKKIEGQVRGVSRMIEDDRYCVDILMQIAAVKSGMEKIGLQIMENHIKGCVTKAIKEDHGDRQIAELMDILRKFMK